MEGRTYDDNVKPEAVATPHRASPLSVPISVEYIWKTGSWKMLVTITSDKQRIKIAAFLSEVS